MMKRWKRWLGIALGLVVVVALGAILWVWIASSRALGAHYDPAPETLSTPTAAERADAPRQARIHGCVSCHGDGLRGQLMFDEPKVARIWAPNLTEIAAAGASDQQLAQAIRQGIGHDGRGLWVMPSAIFSRLSDGEVAALILYIRSLPRGPGPQARIAPGPLGMIGIATGGLRPARDGIGDYRRRQPFNAGPQFQAGRRIAALVCAECHGPDLKGGEAGPDQKAPDLIVAGAYSPDQFRTLMRTGRPPSGRDLRLMAEVSKANFAHFSDAEIAALLDYLHARAERMPQ